MPQLPFLPVFIIGAPRSGTNILRDVLTALPGFATWDCDEINPIWRHGHVGRTSDRFTADLVSARSRKFLRHRFIDAWRRFGEPPILVEKTCANSLRVPYIAEVFPEARFIFLHRDGMDVVASAQKRWRGELEVEPLPYYVAKLRNTPLVDIPVYGWRFATARWKKLFGKEHLSFWGPQYPGLDEDLRSRYLDEVCARQWAACAGIADCDLQNLEADSVMRIAYEDFVGAPASTVAEICAWIDVSVEPDDIKAATRSVRADSLGLGRKQLEAAGRLDAIKKIVDPINNSLGRASF